ncbi:MAG: hypothetical protein WBQ11_02515 [Isosphaeraceae bacterium]
MRGEAAGDAVNDPRGVVAQHGQDEPFTRRNRRLEDLVPDLGDQDLGVKPLAPVKDSVGELSGRVRYWEFDFEDDREIAADDCLAELEDIFPPGPAGPQ